MACNQVKCPRWVNLDQICPDDVRFPPVSDQEADIARCLKRAKGDTVQDYSITRSASNCRELDTVRPRAAAVLRLMISSYLSGS
jgi:hypothetical protein